MGLYFYDEELCYMHSQQASTSSQCSASRFIQAESSTETEEGEPSDDNDTRFILRISLRIVNLHSVRHEHIYCS